MVNLKILNQYSKILSLLTINGFDIFTANSVIFEIFNKILNSKNKNDSLGLISNIKNKKYVNYLNKNINKKKIKINNFDKISKSLLKKKYNFYIYEKKLSNFILFDLIKLDKQTNLYKNKKNYHKNLDKISVNYRNYFKNNDNLILKTVVKNINSISKKQSLRYRQLSLINVKISNIGYFYINKKLNYLELIFKNNKEKKNTKLRFKNNMIKLICSKLKYLSYYTYIKIILTKINKRIKMIPICIENKFIYTNFSKSNFNTSLKYRGLFKNFIYSKKNINNILFENMFKMYKFFFKQKIIRYGGYKINTKELNNNYNNYRLFIILKNSNLEFLNKKILNFSLSNKKKYLYKTGISNTLSVQFENFCNINFLINYKILKNNLIFKKYLYQKNFESNVDLFLNFNKIILF
jgi:hypothetical protein